MYLSAKTISHSFTESSCEHSEICRQELGLQKPIEVSWFNPGTRLECNCEQNNAKLLVHAKCTIVFSGPVYEHSEICRQELGPQKPIDGSRVQFVAQACQLIGSSTNVPQLKYNIYVLFQDLVVNTVRSVDRSWVCRNLQKYPGLTLVLDLIAIVSKKTLSYWFIQNAPQFFFVICL